VYLDEFSVVGGSREDSDVDHLEHAGVVTAGLILFQTVVLGCVLVVLDGQRVLSVALVDLGDALLGLGDVGDAIGGNVELDGGLQELDALCVRRGVPAVLTFSFTLAAST
jgi:hypothetical protein